MSKEVPRLDALDVRILEQLQTDETLPVAELAEQVGSSKTVVWRRIQRLQDLGVIRGRVALLDHKKVGLPIMIFAHIKMTRHDRDVLPKFIEAVDALPQVIEAHTLMGNVDFLLKIVMSSLEDYEHFVWQKLSKIDGVREISSSISLSQNVNRTRLPLRPG
ncbi:Lrp/AsnC family transcriptional regulator [Hydrocarboniphaga sp.]|uniref:Lrp/AsnC family transcriptional regulator n=1 Tax=Hydrocarboniphaga sp. TaxID=2033016 RepID=UPI003D0E21FC